MVRTPCCKAELGLKKGAWTPEEDQKLLSYLNRHGEGGWRTLPEKAGLKRCGKSCRLRWANYLRPDIKRGEFTEDEECSIISLHALHGNKWSAIARGLPGRTDNEIKNYWNTHIKKRLIKKGIDPVTHKSIIFETMNSEEVSEKQTTSDHDIDHNEIKGEKKKKNGKSDLPSARFLNILANRFGKRINQSVLSEIIGSGVPLTTSHTTSSSASIDSESDKSTSSSFTPSSNLVGNLNQTSSSSMFFDCDPQMYFDDHGDTIGFSRFMNDEDIMMLEDSCVENNVFMEEIARFLQEDGNDVVNVTPVYEPEQDLFEEIDNYFG